MSDSHGFSVELEQREGFEFAVRFDWPGVPELVLDEPEPLGERKGPNAARLVGAAVANCLAASLVFCLKNKFRQNPGPVRARATGRLERNDKGRYRIAGIDVVLGLSEKFGDMPHQERCLEQFEDFCIVTESIRRGIPVTVSVRDAAGETMKTNDLSTSIEERCASLRLRHPAVRECRVNVEDRPARLYECRRFNVRLDIAVDGHEIVVNREHDDDPAAALDEAFAAAHRQLDTLHA